MKVKSLILKAGSAADPKTTRWFAAAPMAATKNHKSLILKAGSAADQLLRFCRFIYTPILLATLEPHRL
jgi:hypothetical protein